MIHKRGSHQATLTEAAKYCRGTLTKLSDPGPPAGAARIYRAPGVGAAKCACFWKIPILSG